jgi:DNA-binding response OmpR family regulator
MSLAMKYLLAVLDDRYSRRRVEALFLMNGRRTGAEMRVIVVEDHRVLADAIAEGLRRESMAVDVTYDGQGALDRLAVTDYDVVVLDRDLPRVSGDEVCAALATSPDHARVLMLTAAGSVRDRVAGLNLGADDYLPKPFDFAELVARVRALGRRTLGAHSPVLCRAGITVDPSRFEVRRDGQVVNLSRKEFAVLAELLRADGAVVSAEQLLDRVWDENVNPFTNVIRVVVMSLRRKLGEPAVVRTVHGVGYQVP